MTWEKKEELSNTGLSDTKIQQNIITKKMSPFQTADLLYTGQILLGNLQLALHFLQGTQFTSAFTNPSYSLNLLKR